MQPFYITALRTPSEYFLQNVFYNKNLSEIQDKHFISCFNHTKESVSSKNTARLLNKTVNEI